MTRAKYSKIRAIDSYWPSHAIMTTTCLNNLGYSNSNIQKYKNSKWIESVGYGAYKRVGGDIEWHGAVHALNPDFHVGGKTALEEHGVAHYITMREHVVYLFSYTRKNLPKWLQACCKSKIRYVQTGLIRSEMGITYKEQDNLKLKISSRERAILEFISLLGKEHSFEECNLMMQSLSTLRPSLLQPLLEACTNVKVKRVFLFLARRNNHAWIQDLNFNKIDLGSGYREVVKHGILDPRFNINYPPSLFRDESQF